MANIENKDTKKDIKKRQVKALFSYTPVNIDELQLKVNDILEVVEETEEGWWKGVLDGNVGMFPSNFVIELDGFPEELNNKLMNELSPSKHVSKAKTVPQQEPRLSNNATQSKRDSKQASTNSVNSDTVDGSCSSKASSETTLERKIILIKKSSGDSVAPRLPPKPIREQAKVLFPYESNNEDELTLKEGDIITVLSKEIEDKGWWKGELNNKIGVFPDNFVKIIKAEEQKKPERPDKPAAVIASRHGLKSVGSEKAESSPKVDKKIIRVPPAKPPPPELNKKEPDRPPPPCPSKKPQPVKKPTRSSLGPRIAALISPTSENAPSAFTPPAEKCEEGARSEVVLRKEVDLEFDAIESSGKKLEHMTANRAKAPSRRPPSYIFMKESEKDHTVTDSRRLSEPSIGDIQQLLPLSDTKKSNAVSTSNVEMRPKVPPTRPCLPVMRSNSISKNDSIDIKDGGVIEESNVKPQDIRKKETISEKVSSLMKDALQPKPMEPNQNIPSTRSSGISARLQNLCKVMPDVAKAPADVTKTTQDVTKSYADVASGDALKAAPDVAVKPATHETLKTFSSETSRVTLNASPKPSNSHSNVQSVEVVPSLPTKTSTNSVKPPYENFLKSNNSLEAEVWTLKDALKDAIVNMVSKNDYNALLKQVDDLKSTIDNLNAKYGEAISDLKGELEVEKQLRQAVESELQTLKLSQKT